MFQLPHDPRLWPGNPSFKASFPLFLLYGYALLACLGDVYYTGIGLSKKLTEGNPINKFLFAKIGQALTAFLEIGAVTVVGGVMSMYSIPAAYAFWGAIAAVETYNTLRNRKLVSGK